jgi:hypothetical protein
MELNTMRLIPALILFLFCWLAVPSQIADGQTAPPVTQNIDEGIEDTGTLRTSARIEMHDLRQPIGFERVYQLRDGTERYVRMHGAINAVFSRSTYTQGGTVPTVPPGTVFFIGAPPQWNDSITANPALTPPSGSRLIDSRVSNRVLPTAVHPTGSTATQTLKQPTVWSSEEYRRARMATLLLENSADQ